MRKVGMRVLYTFLLLCLTDCSSLAYEYEWMKQRSEAKRSDNYVAWEVAKQKIVQRCSAIKFIYQGHSKVVYVSFGNEDAIESISDYLDEVLNITDECRPEDTAITME